MKAHITVITLGVDDLDRSLRFYRDVLKFDTKGIIGKEFEHGAVAFFDLQAGLKLAIWPRKSFAHDSGLPLGKASATELSIGHNVSSKTEVDAVMEQASDPAFYARLQMQCPQDTLHAPGGEGGLVEIGGCAYIIDCACS